MEHMPISSQAPQVKSMQNNFKSDFDGTTRSLPPNWRYGESHANMGNLTYHPNEHRLEEPVMATRPNSSEVQDVKHPCSPAISEHMSQPSWMQSQTTDTASRSNYAPRLPLVTDHEDILRTPKGTLVNMAGSENEFRPAYIVKFGHFAEYAEFILNAPFDQWLDCYYKHPVLTGRPSGRNVPLLVTLLHLRDINDWLGYENLFTCYLLQACDWIEQTDIVKEEEPTDYTDSLKQDSRVQRIRRFKSCEEAAANVYLDGYLQGISSIFACLMIDASKVDPALYSRIKMQCMQQMLQYRDIAVHESSDKLIIY